MNFQSLVNNLVDNTLHVSLPLFRPELAISATIVVMLLVRVFRWGEKINPFWIALIGAAIALWYALPAGGLGQFGNVERHEIFTGMLIYDSMTAFFRVFLLFFAVLFVVLVRMTGLADRDDGQDFYTLLLGSTLGMCLMASTNHLMTVFLAVEMASVPSYVLAGIIKGRRRASEAALKYAVFGAGAAGVMLYGISLLAGLVGSAHLPTIAARLVEMDIPRMMGDGDSSGKLMVLALAALMISVGLAFKLSAVPFHFWCPDVFEGASAEVDAFLSIASKAAALALLVRIALGVSAVPAREAAPAPANASIHRVVPVRAVAMLQSADGQPASAGENTPSSGQSLADQDAPATPAAQLAPVRTFIVRLLAVIAAITCTFGNLVAYGQTNIKRLLAYSTIAHAGYMIMAVAAAVQLAGSDVVSAREAIAALLFYVSAYLFMNLGAFAIVAFLRGVLQSEEIADYAGLIRVAPLTSVAFTAILVSLIGIPPLAGFVGKFAIFRSLVIAGGPWMIALLVIAGLNTVVSLVYYLRVAKTICIDPEPDARGLAAIGFLPAVYVLLITLPVLVFGILPQSLTEWARQASEQLLM
ncbi:MAG: NADH-quinone oxidoreductase subunit N [Planctomycetes bacterium]|nr:NADH-quinone oxidoreductase subunit N [Planctomycetota bacterium]